MSRIKGLLLGRHASVFAIAWVGFVVIAGSLSKGVARVAFFDSLFLIGAALPLVLSFVVQIVLCRRNKVPFQSALSSPDAFVFLLAPLIWSYAITLADPKGLSNLLEVPLIGSVWGLCVAVRTILVLRNHPCATWFGSWITLVIVTTTTALMGIFFPGLPE